MPFKSKSQRGYMFVHHPEIAKRWADETPDMKGLPAHVKQSRRTAMLSHMKGK